ncbi:MAG: PP2C family protein-serine/threonine phosphatase [Bacteroidota bacterium]
MPISPPCIPGFDVAVSARPRRSGGGDYHAVFTPPGGASMAVAVGDVAGHDPLAAHLMAIAGHLLHRHAMLPGRLGEVMTSVNRSLTPHMRAGRFMTLFLAVMVAERQSVHWVSAGHAPVLAYDPVQDRFGDVPGHDIPLGIDAAWQYRELCHSGWSCGALLVVGTDGVWEARDPTGAMYGKTRLMERIHAARSHSAAAIVSAVEADVEAFRHGRPADDDATLLVVKAA